MCWNNYCDVLVGIIYAKRLVCVFVEGPKKKDYADKLKLPLIPKLSQ